MLPLCIFLSMVVLTQAQMEGFIVGGSLASINRYPHSAFLTVICMNEEREMLYWICGSSILNQRILITAAHCVHPCIPGTHISVNMGNENRERGVVRTASRFLIHEKYNQAWSANDIGLIMMARPVRFNLRISRVAILKRPPYGEQAKLAGWGYTNEINRTEGIVLKEVDQKVWKRVDCQRLFGEMPKGTICASSKKQNDFAAAGDSGSGLIVRDYIQIGVVSYKKPTLANNIIIYSDVGYFYDWITYNAYRLYCFTSLD